MSNNSQKIWLLFIFALCAISRIHLIFKQVKWVEFRPFEIKIQMMVEILWVIQALNSWRCVHLELLSENLNQDGKLRTTLQDPTAELNSGRQTHWVYFTYSCCMLSIVLISITFITHLHTHTHKHTSMISEQEEWRESGTGAGAWLDGAEIGFVRDKGLAHTHATTYKTWKSKMIHEKLKSY